LFDYNNRSHDVSQVMSSLDEDSIESNKHYKQGVNANAYKEFDPFYSNTLSRASSRVNSNGAALIFNKNLQLDSIKEMTIENIAPGKSHNMFNDFNSKSEVKQNIVIEKPQIAEELQKEKELREQEEAKRALEAPSEIQKPKKKKTKLGQKKRSKSWDEEVAKVEQLKRKAQEERRGSLAVRKDVVNKTLLRSMKRFITQKFEQETGIINLSNEEKKQRFLELLEAFTRNYIPKVVEIQKIEDNNDDDENIISQNGVRFIVGLIVSQQLMRSHINSIKERTFFYQYYQLLNKYSHKKLLRLMKNSNFIFVIANFKENGGLEELIKTDQTLMRNPQAYYEAANSFINKLSIL